MIEVGALFQVLSVLKDAEEVSVNEFEQSEISCLAENIYFEARNQSLAGKIAVGLVTLNRVKDNRFPDSVCAVVKQGPTYTNWKGNVLPVKHKCQFSWYCDGKPETIEQKYIEYYKEIIDISIDLYYNEFYDITEGSTHYHADYVSPDWASTKTKTTEIDDHIFYRWENK